MTQSPRFAEEIEFGSMAAAEMVRKQFPDIIHDADDARTRTVAISESTPRQVRIEIQMIQYRARDDERAGQLSLTPFEREYIDFTETNVPHARACKALATQAGVDDWLAYYDTTLSTDEHREIYGSHGSGAEITMRDMDAVEAGFYG